MNKQKPKEKETHVVVCFTRFLPFVFRRCWVVQLLFIAMATTRRHLRASTISSSPSRTYWTLLLPAFLRSHCSILFPRPLGHVVLCVCSPDASEFFLFLFHLSFDCWLCWLIHSLQDKTGRKNIVEESKKVREWKTKGNACATSEFGG